MALADLAKASTKIPPRGSCGVCWVSGQLEPQDAADLEAALENRAAPLVKITEELNLLGYPIGTSTVERHAAGQCSAGRKYRA